MKRETVYHTEIKFFPVAKNGSERFGVEAKCKFWYEGSRFKIDTCAHGKTKEEAEWKLLEFMSANGFNSLELVEAPAEKI